MYSQLEKSEKTAKTHTPAPRKWYDYTTWGTLVMAMIPLLWQLLSDAVRDELTRLDLAVLGISLLLIIGALASYQIARSRMREAMYKEKDENREAMYKEKKENDERMLDFKSKEENCRKEKKSLQRRIEQAQTNTDIWATPPRAEIPKIDTAIRTKFVAVINLKGGVGKTTLTANMAKSLLEKKIFQRILLIDLDFQYTLTSMVVKDDNLYQDRNKRQLTSEQLLNPDFKAQDVEQLILPGKVEGIDLIPAGEVLERVENRVLISFLLQEEKFKEVRFFMRQVLRESPDIRNYDLVLFDCPPRITASAINALAASTHYLIPTKLDKNSTDASSRTIAWVESLHKSISDIALLGIVANEVRTRDAAGQSRPLNEPEQLFSGLKERFPEKVFEKYVPLSQAITEAVDDWSNAQSNLTFYQDIAREFQGKLSRTKS